MFRHWHVSIWSIGLDSLIVYMLLSVCFVICKCATVEFKEYFIRITWWVYLYQLYVLYTVFSLQFSQIKIIFPKKNRKWFRSTKKKKSKNLLNCNKWLYAEKNIDWPKHNTNKWNNRYWVRPSKVSKNILSRLRMCFNINSIRCFGLNCWKTGYFFFSLFCWSSVLQCMQKTTTNKSANKQVNEWTAKKRKKNIQAICSSCSWLNMWHDHYETDDLFFRCILLIVFVHIAMQKKMSIYANLQCIFYRNTILASLRTENRL